MYGKIPNDDVYKNWTSEYILKHREAVFKGVKSDECLREILEISAPGQQCIVGKICQDMMLNKYRNDTGYLLTHR